MSEKKKILLIDDDTYYVSVLREHLVDEGFQALTAGTMHDGKRLVNDNPDAYAIIVDMMMPPGLPQLEEEADTWYGNRSGLVLARWVKQCHPNIHLIGTSSNATSDALYWFTKYGLGFINKYELPTLHDVVAQIKRMLSIEERRKHLKIFIVHGHDNASKYELKNYLQNSLLLPEPVILHEQPSLGRTIMEKFEEEASRVDAVCVLLTPDDAVCNSSSPDNLKRRARQNVIFEMGYFFGKLQRKKAKVLLLYKGELDLPSDISGIVYIDITNGVEAEGETIRRELSAIL
jgi:CheY-like chemotaxis protein